MTKSLASEPAAHVLADATHSKATAVQRQSTYIKDNPTISGVTKHGSGATNPLVAFRVVFAHN